MQSYEKMDKDIESLHRSEIGAAKIEGPSPNNLPVTLSNPALLDGFISSKSVCTVLVVVVWTESAFLAILSC